MCKTYHNRVHHVFYDSINLAQVLNYTVYLWSNLDIVLSDFINLTQVHNFTVSEQDIFTFRRLSVFTVSFTGILQVYLCR